MFGFLKTTKFDYQIFQKLKECRISYRSVQTSVHFFYCVNVHKL